MQELQGGSFESFKWPELGCGIGLRQEHYQHVLQTKPKVAFFEAISENYMDSEGNPILTLEKVRENYPVVLHGVSLSIGTVDDLNQAYLQKLSQLVNRIQPSLVSDHLCWTGVDGVQLYDLLPLPYTYEALLHVVERIQKVQEFLGRQILIENISTYVTFQADQITEWDFLNEVSKRSGCGLLLDLNNIYVNSKNHQFDPRDYLNGIDAHRVGQIHLGGHTDMGEFLFDTHSKEILPEVWNIYNEALQSWGPLNTLIEWDADIPQFEEVFAECEKARTFYEKAKPRLKDAPAVTSFKSDDNAKPAQSLAECQRWFKTFIDPRQVKAEDELLNVQAQTKGRDRLAVYAEGYLARMEEALADVYRAIKHLLGAGAFQGLAVDYAHSQSWNHYSLSHVGARFPEFLKSHVLLKNFPFLEDLAKWEWKVAESFHGKVFPQLDSQKLQMLTNVDPENLVFEFQPGLVLMDSEYPLCDLWEARHTPVKEVNLKVVGNPQRVACFRRGVQVHAELLSKDQYLFLSTLKDGKSLGEACEVLAENNFAESPIGEWFLFLAQNGLITQLQERSQRTF